MPDGVTEVHVVMWGAGGGGYNTDRSSGAGGYTEGTMRVSPGDTLTVIVGGGGHPDTPSFHAYGGGGKTSRPQSSAAGGGGRSAIKNAVGSEAGTAGGGGGAGNDNEGGAGGGASGKDGHGPSKFRGTPDCNESAALHSYGLDAHCRSVLRNPATGHMGGKGGTQSSGGAAGNGGGCANCVVGNAGSRATGADSNTNTGQHHQGGGGGGYFGGGSGGRDSGSHDGGGGGGSGYIGGFLPGTAETIAGSGPSMSCGTPDCNKCVVLHT